MSLKAKVWLSLSAMAGLFVLITILSTWYRVGETERTVVARFGEFSTVNGPGLHFRIPFADTIETFNVAIQQVSPNKPLNTYTVDNQEIDVGFTLFYRVPADSVEFLYKNVPDYRERLFRLAIDRFKSEAGKINANELARGRATLRDSVTKVLSADAQRLLRLEVVDFQLTDIHYDEKFLGAVRAAMIAKADVEKIRQEVEKAEQEAIRIKTEAEGTANAARERAKGEADARLLVAEAEAKAIKLKGEAEAAAIKAQAEALANNAQLVSLRQAERWNGALPQQMFGGTSGPLPILSINNPGSNPLAR